MTKRSKVQLTDDISLTFYLTATRKANRLKKTVWIESIYYEILKEKNVIISDLVNYLLEKYFREMGYLDVEEYLDSEDE
ncbi:MAG: hypothetical protein ACOC5L_03800 [Halobacteriota archaeon]